MEQFIDGIKDTLNNDFNVSVTENGAVGYRTSGKELLNLNYYVSSLRRESESKIYKLFTKALFEDKKQAVKWLFYARDIRGGLGERRLFRACLNALARDFPEYVRPVIKLVPEYGRWDDLWGLLDTSLRDDVVRFVRDQLAEDVENMNSGLSVSLLAKWMPRIKTSSKKTRYYARILRSSLLMSDREYQHTMAKLSKYIKVTEQKMSAKKWSEIDYDSVPSRANLLYRNAFIRHDAKRRLDYLEKVNSGKAKINASTLFPHDIVHRYLKTHGVQDDIELLWQNLPDTVNGCGNTIVVADGSGSMLSRVGNTSVTAMCVATSLAIYFAERSSGAFRNRFITFSESPKLIEMGDCKNLKEKMCVVAAYREMANTNVEAVFDLILKTAINGSMSQNDLPENILIISDMEFDECVVSNRDHGFSGERMSKRLFDEIAGRYANAGFKMPRLIFWNVCSRTMTIPIIENEMGVALVSGFSPNIAKMVMSGQTDPYECLMETLNSKRYQPVEDAILPYI